MADVGTRLREATRLVSPPDPAFERLVRRRDRIARNRRIGSMIVALSLTGVVLGVVFATLAGLGGDAGRRPEAEFAAPSRDLALEQGSFFYEHTVLVIPRGVEGIQGGTVEIDTWWGPDGSGRVDAESDTPSYRPRESGTWGPGEFPADETISDLSTDPATLEDQLLGRSSPGGASPQPNVTPGVAMTADSGRLWRAVEALVEMPNAVPELRAALFQIVSRLDGVEVREDASDPVDRPAIVATIQSPSGAGTIELFFDPETLQPMGSKATYQEGTWYRIVVEAGIVDSIGDDPSSDQRFFPQPAAPLPSP